MTIFSLRGRKPTQKQFLMTNRKVRLASRTDKMQNFKTVRYHLTKGDMLMAGYSWHTAHALYTWLHLSDELKKHLGDNGFKNMLVGAYAPDIATDKDNTHYYANHPVYGSSYKIPNMGIVDSLYLKADAYSLGILSHLQYDVDHINNFLLVYGKPVIENGKKVFLNTQTGDTMTEIQFFGDWKRNVYGQLYMLYDRFNGDIVERIMPILNQCYNSDFSNTKDGFRAFLKWMYPNNIPLTGIEDMDKYRDVNTDIHTIIANFFNGDGEGCIIKADANSITEILMNSAKALANRINKTITI